MKLKQKIKTIIDQTDYSDEGIENMTNQIMETIIGRLYEEIPYNIDDFVLSDEMREDIINQILTN